MPLLVLAAIFFLLFVAVVVLVAMAVLSETRGMPGSFWQYKRRRVLPQKH